MDGRRCMCPEYGMGCIEKLDHDRQVVYRKIDHIPNCPYKEDLISERPYPDDNDGRSRRYPDDENYLRTRRFNDREYF